ncbi:hypothetical protein BaRGS_00008418 [Batillaria attramentaria]|uniref:Uncharacterized protein n=1 Tax=Batillaria attramentaria TaxID=370345 RepID=A0ABD0LL22_9CAEN
MNTALSLDINFMYINFIFGDGKGGRQSERPQTNRRGTGCDVCRDDAILGHSASFPEDLNEADVHARAAWEQGTPLADALAPRFVQPISC